MSQYGNYTQSIEPKIVRCIPNTNTEPVDWDDSENSLPLKADPISTFIIELSKAMGYVAETIRKAKAVKP